MVGSPHIHMLCGREGGLVGGHGAAAGVEEHTLNLMPKAPSSYNFFVPVDSCARWHTHTHKCTNSHIHGPNRNSVCCLKEIMTLSGREVIGLHWEPGKKSDVQCIYYA